MFGTGSRYGRAWGSLFRARFRAREARDPVVFGVSPASHSSRPRSTLRVGGLGYSLGSYPPVSPSGQVDALCVTHAVDAATKKGCAWPDRPKPPSCPGISDTRSRGWWRSPYAEGGRIRSKDWSPAFAAPRDAGGGSVSLACPERLLCNRPR